MALGLGDFSLPDVLIVLIGNQSAQNGVAEAVNHLLHHAKTEGSDACHPELAILGVLVALWLVLVAPDIDRVHVVEIGCH